MTEISSWLLRLVRVALLVVLFFFLLSTVVAAGGPTEGPVEKAGLGVVLFGQDGHGVTVARHRRGPRPSCR